MTLAPIRSSSTQWGWNINYEVEFKWFAIMFVGMFVAIALTSFAPSEREKVQQQRWNDCVVSVNKTIPDANATEERSALLAYCYEQAVPKR